MVGDILQPTHLLFILVVALLVLGPKRLPEVGRSLGNGLRDFRSAVSGESHERHDEITSPVIAETAQPTPVSVETAQPTPVPVETAQPVGDPAQHTT